MTAADIARIASETQTIAIVGLSPKPERPSHGVARFLQEMGYRIIPVNPGHAGETILGETTYASLSDIPESEAVDMVDIFRRSDSVPPVVDEALACLPELKTVWMQIGVMHEGAAEKARAAGMTVVQNRCPAIDFPRVGARGPGRG
ncbi:MULTISPECIES: CoA-binding protein [unclassified Paracoccus (in: a-proteobacteria)]|uniref:CoA-binding protein n=1 Tax=unclassified Paracoccus (in: a-proteobacteria) TaxID=2688777 RepID=UPI001601152A|nr:MULTISPECIES: CoA-binding protein [unclassified Paracoccus (in: a-proteobacteria)]MBB1490627.1 CoA-binding protein [Paracoccus sp. MC1854]MBB1499305.1 CoA-binding protein [Paracoccus sp. MC1862]QQO46035.1 CoA-binding protein [Paracoccus sp. MC1862]